MKRGISIIVGFGLMLASYGCFVDHRDDGYRRHHEEYRGHEDRRDGGHEGDYNDNRDRDEHGDYGDQH